MQLVAEEGFDEMNNSDVIQVLILYDEDLINDELIQFDSGRLNNDDGDDEL